MTREYLFSFSRDAMLKRCLREYYLHVFYAYGEYDVESADKNRNLCHILKQLKSEEAFKEFLLAGNLRKIFVDGMLFKDLKYSLIKDFFRAKDDMLLERYKYDHLQSPVLKDFYYENINLRDTFSAILSSLEKWADALLENDLFIKLFEQEIYNFHPVPDVVSVFAGNIKVYLPLLGVIKYNGLYYCININRFSENNEKYAVLNLLYCQQKLHASPVYVRHIFLNSESILTFFEDNAILNISQILNEIAEKSAVHYSIFKELERVDSPFFLPGVNDVSSCKNCRFHEFCKG